MSFRPMFSALQEIADAVLARFTDPTLAAEFKSSMTSYHSFWRRTLPRALWRPAAENAGLGECEIQVELVEVISDRQDETHLHRKSGTLIVILETRSGLSSQTAGPSTYTDGAWRKVQMGNILEIPPGKVHGFTVEHLGLLRFLSIQYPPITRPDGEDDYVRAPS